MFIGELFDLHFRNPLGTESTSAPRPRKIFRRKDAAAFVEIGPMSYNAKAGNLRDAVSLLMRRRPDNQVIAFRLSKDPESASEDSIRLDYLSGFTYAYDFADFFVFDFTGTGPSLDLAPDFIEGVLDPILDARLSYEDYKPIVLKLSTELPESGLHEILHFCLMNRIDGVEVSDLAIIRKVCEFSGGRLPVIAFGEIGDTSQVRACLNAGASLVNLGRCPRALPATLLKQLKNNPLQ